MKKTDVVVIGAGSTGVACAYYLKAYAPALQVVLIDSHAPLSYTSAHSGENYRNWWPHPTMKQYIDRSLDLVEQLEQHTGQSLRQNSRGYVLCTAEPQPHTLLQNLKSTFNESLRQHQSEHSCQSQHHDGVDVFYGRAIESLYPRLAHQAGALVHIRRGGALDTQLMASVMLEQFKAQQGVRLQGTVTDMVHHNGFSLQVAQGSESVTVRSQYVVNAAGPCASEVSDLLGVSLPLENVLQQKVSFEDTLGVIPRDLPFTIDIDDITLDWTAEEHAALAQDADMQRFTVPMAGAIHCRPEGSGKWVKLGWAYNQTPGAAVREPVLDAEFPEIVIRGASRLHPGLSKYIGAFPGGSVHYGGYYTMTKENWPLIGETGIPGYLIAAGLSGFGSMAACATGELIGLLVAERVLPAYAADLSLARYDHPALLQELAALNDKGLL